MTETPPDWVLIEAAKRSGWCERRPDIIRKSYSGTFRALCDMIAKHEQPPVDEDWEALIRILQAADISPDDIFPNNLTRAVAQYKKEIARD